MRRHRWREVAPNPIRTASASTAKVQHAASIIGEMEDGSPRAGTALCGVRPRYGWSRYASDLPRCERCEKSIRAYGSAEVK